MKILNYITTILFLTNTFAFCADKLPDHHIFDQLLKKHVKNDRVDYQNFLKDQKELLSYVKQFETITDKDLNKNEQLAFYINAYNAFTIALILENYSEKFKSIKDIEGPWDIKRGNIGGVKYSLNEIETKFLRETLKDPRIHFAINCASISCPPLQPYAFFPETVDAQLTTVTKKFINSPQGLKITNHTLEISHIFNWYKADFETEKNSVTDFITKYLTFPPDLSKLPIKYQEYNWNLNDTKTK